MYARYVPPAKGRNLQRDSAPAPPEKPSPASPPNLASAPAATPVSLAQIGGDGFAYSRYVPGRKPNNGPESNGLSNGAAAETAPASPKRKRDGISGREDLSGQKKSRQGDFETTSQWKGAAISELRLNGQSHQSRAKTGKRNSCSRSPSPTLENLRSTSTKKATASKNFETKPAKKNKKENSHLRETEEGHIDKEAPADIDGNVQMDDQSVPVQESKVEREKPKTLKRKKAKKADPEENKPDEDSEGVSSRHKAVMMKKTKSLKLAGELPPATENTSAAQDPVELHPLEPLPQPDLGDLATPKPTYETLPEWLAAPIRVSRDAIKPFADLGILPKASRVLQERGFENSFAVQTAAIPLLLPNSKERPGDVLISAATGSGKTLAYALPIVKDLSQNVITRLRCLVVLPTRELVKQAQEVFELCAKAYDGGTRKRVRIGVAIGSRTLKSEQESLMEGQSRYDPQAYQRIVDEVRSKGLLEMDDTSTDPSLDIDDPRIGRWQGQIVDFASKVDVLICTPGRLVEHIEQTPGFSLDYVRWLVVDEADKLLAQRFQGWLDVVMEKFKFEVFGARDFPDIDFYGVRKVILSATLTRDLSLLNQLSLRRPRLIVLEGDAELQAVDHSLPELLAEFAIRVRDANLKPLYLMDLLQSKHMISPSAAKSVSSKEAIEGTRDDSSATSPDSSETSDSAEESDSSETSSEGSDTELDASPVSKKRLASAPSGGELPISLIFTKSNESALRLSRLLVLLDGSLATRIATLTSTTPSAIRRKTLRAFTAPSSPIRIIVASDLIARGIDLPKLEHVVNYDLPTSVTAYVHRVGRTARAGRSGCAWTLVSDDESGWFWGRIAKSASMGRSQKVGRVIIEDMSEERIEQYESALAKLGKEAINVEKR